MNILNYRNPKQVKGNIIDLEIQTTEYGWIPITIDRDNVDVSLSHMVDIDNWLTANAGLIIAKTNTELLNEAKANKLVEIEQARNQAIDAPVVSSALGASHTYSAKAANRQFLNDLITLGNGSKFTCIDSDGVKARRMHTITQLLTLAGDIQTSITQDFDTYETLLGQVEAASTVAAVEAIQWS